MSNLTFYGFSYRDIFYDNLKELYLLLVEIT